MKKTSPAFWSATAICLHLWMTFFLSLPLSGQTIDFTIVHTSDEHSMLSPWPLHDYHDSLPGSALGGFARLAGLVGQLGESNKNVLLFSSGDFMGGSPHAWLITQGYAPEINIMQQVGYNAVTLGNHEFDYGSHTLAQYLKTAGYPQKHEKLPVVASNLDIPPDHPLNNAGLKKHTIIRLPEGIKIGILGLLGETAYSLAPTASPVTIIDSKEAAAKQVGLLKEKGVDVIIALTHSGLAEDRELADAVPGIHLILGGHDHHLLQAPEKRGETIIMHSGTYLRQASVLQLKYDRKTNKLSVNNEETAMPFVHQLSGDIHRNDGVHQTVESYGMLLDGYLEQITGGVINSHKTTIMHTDFPLRAERSMGETTIGHFVADAMRWYGEKTTEEKVDVAFQANGLIRGELVPGSMEWSKGHIGFMDLASVAGLGTGPDGQPGYPMVSFYLTGKEIMALLEIAALLPQLMGSDYYLQFSGLTATYDAAKTTWGRIPFTGTPIPSYKAVVKAELYEGVIIPQSGHFETIRIEENKLYHVVSDHYLSAFLPLIGERLPKLGLVLKNKNGQPIQPGAAIIRNDGRETKVWEALIYYGMSFEKNQNGLPQVPVLYRESPPRVIRQEGFPLSRWPQMLAGLLMLGFAAFMIRRYRKKKRTKSIFKEENQNPGE